MPYTIVFQNSDNHSDQMWLANPKVGDVVKTNLLSGQELEYWTITRVERETVFVAQI